MAGKLSPANVERNSRAVVRSFQPGDGFVRPDRCPAHSEADGDAGHLFNTRLAGRRLTTITAPERV